MPTPISALARYIENLRFPVLVLLMLGLLALNLVIPDALPFVDELLMATTAILLARIKRKPDGVKAAAKSAEQSKD